jgi:integrase
MASIVRKRLSNGSAAYLVRFRTADGRQRSKQFGRRRDAEHYARAVEIERATGSLVDPRLGQETLDDWWRRWWPTVTNLRASSRARDETYYRNHVQPAFGTTPLSRIDRSSLREWVAELDDPEGAGLAPASVQKAVQVINKILRAAVDDRLIISNPADRLPLPKIERREMRFISATELGRLSDTIDPAYRAFVLLGGYGGLRLGELLGLRWRRVDLEQGQVHIAEILNDVRGDITFGPPKTRASNRRITLPAFVCDALQPTTRPEPDALVFPSPRGHPIRQSLFRRRIWQPAVEAADLTPLRIHDLRHTAVSLWIAAGANPKQIAARAGHSSVSVVLDRYGHLYPDHDQTLIANLEANMQAET